jgi:hypothetical protein
LTAVATVAVQSCRLYETVLSIFAVADTGTDHRERERERETRREEREF